MVPQFRVPFVKRCSFLILQIATVDTRKYHLLLGELGREVCQWQLMWRVRGVPQNLICSCEHSETPGRTKIQEKQLTKQIHNTRVQNPSPPMHYQQWALYLVKKSNHSFDVPFLSFKFIVVVVVVLTWVIIPTFYLLAEWVWLSKEWMHMPSKLWSAKPM